MDDLSLEDRADFNHAFQQAFDTIRGDRDGLYLSGEQIDVDMSGLCNMCRDDDAVAMMEDETETETETSLLQLLLGNNDVETIIEDPPASASAAAVDALGRRNKSLWPKNNSSQDKKWGDHFDIYLALDMSGKDASANEISSTAYLSEASLRDICGCCSR